MDINETYARIGECIRSDPSETYGRIAERLGVSRSTIARIAKLQGIHRWPGRRLPVLEAAALGTASPKPDCASAGEAVPPSEEAMAAAPDAGRAETAVL